MEQSTAGITSLFDEFYLIEELTPTGVKETENTKIIHSTGGNSKGVVFVFGTTLTAEDTQMTQALIHKAMKLSMEEIALVQTDQNPGLAMQEVINIMKPKFVIVWGTQLGAKDPVLYKVYNSNNIKVLFVESVSTYHDNVPLKTKLWNAIQELQIG